jgi:PEP-CTERM/exosortase A-associated glycosyltransferase
MRILHVLDHGLPLQSGYVSRTLGILRAQRKRGWETLQLTSPKHNMAAGDGDVVEDIDGWSFYRTPCDRLPTAAGVAELALIRRLSRRLDEIVRRENPDIIHAHSPLLNGFPALFVGRRHRIPVIYEVRAFWEDAAVDHRTTTEGSLRYRMTRYLETRLLKRADAVTTICDGLRHEMIGRGIGEERVTVIPNAVDLESFSEHNRKDMHLAKALGLADSIVLGFIGSFYRYEGIDLLIEALPRIIAERPNVKLLLVGGGPYEPELRKATAHARLEPYIVYTGRVNHEDINRYYNLVDVFVFPRRRHRLTELVTPLKPLEAMASRRVVLASDVGGHRELINDGETGYLFPADDASALVCRLMAVLACRDRWPRLQEAGRRFVETSRNWDVCTAPYEHIYHRALERTPRANVRAGGGSPNH